jgi:hypothetical protein
LQVLAPLGTEVVLVLEVPAGTTAAANPPINPCVLCISAAFQVLAQLGTEGVLVLEVPAGTPAAAAGLRATYRDVFGDIVLGDILVGMDTRPIRSTADLVAALDERRPGDKVRWWTATCLLWYACNVDQISTGMLLSFCGALESVV